MGWYGLKMGPASVQAARSAVAGWIRPTKVMNPACFIDLFSIILPVKVVEICSIAPVAMPPDS